MKYNCVYSYLSAHLLVRGFFLPQSAFHLLALVSFLFILGISFPLTITTPADRI